ncbi:MAG: MOSC domain-containing protein [Actinomycetota bacterium]
MTPGSVVSIHVGSSRKATLDRVGRVEAIRGRGLAGDRYCDGTGTWSNHPNPSGKQVTLLEAEVVAGLIDRGLIVGSGDIRRNIVTRSVELSGLIGRRFRVGEAVLFGVRACEPCRYLESLTARGLCEALAGRGGLRADVVAGGCIGVGDTIEVLDRGSLSASGYL